ncbi:MAG: hypothetical protein ACTSPY_16065 [Candidatus Helarchaeota archaeon]
MILLVSLFQIRLKNIPVQKKAKINEINNLDEAVLSFDYLDYYKDTASPNEIVKCRFYLYNSGNLTATNITITLLCKYENLTSFEVEDTLNLIYSINSGGYSSFQTFNIVKNKTGTYYYILNLKYNYTWNSTNYTKQLNSTTKQILVKLRYQPELRIEANVENGLTTLWMYFYNRELYVNLTYRISIYIPGFTNDTFTIIVPLYMTYKLFKYNLTFTPYHLNWWELLVYYSNGEIEKNRIISYDVSVNDSVGNNYSVLVNVFQSSIEKIDNNQLLIKVYMQVQFAWFWILIIILIFGTSIGAGILQSYVKKDVRKNDLIKGYNRLTIYTKKKPIEGNPTRLDLLKYRKDMIEWVRNRIGSEHLYNKLKYIYPGIITAAVISTISSFIIIIISLTFTNIIMVLIMIIIIIISVPTLIVIYLVDKNYFKKIFLQFTKENPHVGVIKEGTWIYLKKYKSLLGFITGFGFYSIFIFSFICIAFYNIHLTQNILNLYTNFLISGLIFGLIFGFIYFFTFNYQLPPWVFSLPIGLAFGYIFYINFDPNITPIIVPIFGYIAIFALIAYFIDRLILILIKKRLVISISNDLSEFFEENDKLYLPNWNFIYNIKRFKIFLKALKQVPLDLEIDGDYLIKK